MTDDETAQAVQILEGLNVLLTGDHFVFTSGNHGPEYFNKDGLYPHMEETERVCAVIAHHFAQSGVEVVVAPAVGAVSIERVVALALTRTHRRNIPGVFADKVDGGFKILRGYEDFVAGKRALVVEDVLNSGGSAKQTVDAVRERGGIPIGVGVLCNRGGVTAEDLGVPELFSIVNVSLESWPAAECPLCARRVPINTRIGAGKKMAPQGA